MRSIESDCRGVEKTGGILLSVSDLILHYFLFICFDTPIDIMKSWGVTVLTSLLHSGDTLAGGCRTGNLGIVFILHIILISVVIHFFTLQQHHLCY